MKSKLTIPLLSEIYQKEAILAKSVKNAQGNTLKLY